MGIIRHPQMMEIMDVVWPINGWFLGPLALWTYFRWGSNKNIDIQDNRHQTAKVFVSTSHCSAGCTVGDNAVGVPFVVWTVTIAGSTLSAHLIVEFILAYIVGIIFKFYTIYPMNEAQGRMGSIKAAIKSDSISLIAFEVGMFG
ncbi:MULTISPECIES: DUF4396 domain-containing protein [Virgibacillus]|nr:MULTISPECIES: DUF4396 domain-containing protein [Virgibacillus]